MYFDRFDICEAYYLFAMHYHYGGDTYDGIFYRLGRMGFKPSPFLGCSDHPLWGLGSENAAIIYNNLVVNHRDSLGIEPELIPVEEAVL